MAVVIPARNEARSLPGLLDSLAAQHRRPDELVVVDDGSEDATARLARERGVAVVEAGAVPAGWTGKAWACAAGVAATRSPVLVFLDADVELAPEALGWLAAEYRGRGGRGLLSAAPEHVARRPHERLSALCQLVAMMGTGAFSLRPDWTGTPAAFGPCMVCSRADYQAAGGYRAVRGEMAEDLALARRFRAGGRPVAMVVGKGRVRVRMYPEGPGQVIRGWSRTLASGAGATRPLTLGLVAAWLSGLMAAAWSAGRAVAPCRPGRRRWSAAVRYAAYAAQVEWLLSRVAGFGTGTGLAYPVPLAAFLVAFARSAAATLGLGRLAWKDRPVDLGRPRCG